LFCVGQITFDNPNSPYDLVDAVTSAVDYAASAAALPVHYLTDDDALTDKAANEPSYANVQAALAVSPGKCASSKCQTTTMTNATADSLKSKKALAGKEGGLSYSYEFDAYLLEAFSSGFVDFVNNGGSNADDDRASSDSFVAFLNDFLEGSGFDARAQKASAKLT
jgi:hypothetical protein